MTDSDPIPATKIKAAALSLCNEKAWVDGKLMYWYALPGMSQEEVAAAADWYYARMTELVRAAAESGAELLVLPENTIEIGKWLRSVDRGLCMQTARRNWDRLVSTVSALAVECGTVIVACSNEPDGSDLFNAAAVVDERGRYLGSYRKVQLTPGEREWLTCGDAFPVFPTRCGRLGIFICWDIIFPETTQTLFVNGAEVLCQPTYGHAGPMADPMARTRAHDTVCPLIVSMWNGNSRIFDRDGSELASTHRTRDWRGIIPHQIIYADIEPRGVRSFAAEVDLKKSILEQRHTELFRPLIEGPRA